MANIQNSNLLHNTTGILSKDACVVLVKTEWNAAITDSLEKGCKRILSKAKAKKLTTIVVPGAVEIAFAIKQHWEKSPKINKPDAYIALGCVIKGDTPHFEYVSAAVTNGIMQLNLLLPVPVIFGVLTVNNEGQAIERIGGKHGHKGEEAAITALKMIALNKSFKN